MNQRIDTGLLHTAQPFADYQQNTAARIDLPAEARAQDGGARVGISRAHESAHLHVAASAWSPSASGKACSARNCATASASSFANAVVAVASCRWLRTAFALRMRSSHPASGAACACRQNAAATSRVRASACRVPAGSRPTSVASSGSSINAANIR